MTAESVLYDQKRYALTLYDPVPRSPGLLRLVTTTEMRTSMDTASFYCSQLQMSQFNSYNVTIAIQLLFKDF